MKKRSELSEEELEKFRRLVYHINAFIDEDKRCLAFTSYIHRQGKTRIIRETGRALARANYKTLIIDCNTVLPTLSKEYIRKQVEKGDLGGEKEEVEVHQEEAEMDVSVQEGGLIELIGIVENLNRELTYEDISPFIRSTEEKNMYLMLRGGELEQSYNEYIHKSTLKKIFKFLKQEFKIVLLEVPCLGYLSYTQMILKASDGYILIIKKGTIPKDETKQIRLSLKTIKCELLGSILNERK